MVDANEWLHASASRGLVYEGDGGVGRKAFERGYCKSGEERKTVLSPMEKYGEGTNGKIEG